MKKQHFSILSSNKCKRKGKHDLKEMIVSFVGGWRYLLRKDVHAFWFAIISTIYEVSGLSPAVLNLAKSLVGSPEREYYNRIDLVMSLNKNINLQTQISYQYPVTMIHTHHSVPTCEQNNWNCHWLLWKCLENAGSETKVSNLLCNSFL